MYLSKSRGLKSPFLHYFVAAPFTLIIIVPAVIFDIFLEVYHRIAFPIYGIPYVKRSEYIHIIDRTKLPYLSFSEKLSCAYCGYVNGWLHYASIIAGRTESYFCAIAHLEARGYIPSKYEKSFVKYGDEASLKKRYFLHDLKYGPEIKRK